jgi:S1-C subfamily serine protease
VDFRDGKGIRPADEVVALGFPYAGLLASSPQVTAGTVSALAGLFDDSRYLQFTAPVQPGNSGGPLLDRSGNLVGIVAARINDVAVAKVTGSLPQNINFAIKTSIVREFLDANRISYLAAPSETKLDPADVGETATKFTVLVRCSQ